jgi:hypothetical protein
VPDAKSRFFEALPRETGPVYGCRAPLSRDDESADGVIEPMNREREAKLRSYEA